MIWVKEEMKFERKWGEYRGAESVSTLTTVQKPCPSGTGTLVQTQCLSGNHTRAPLPLLPPTYCADESSYIPHKFSFPSTPKLYFWRITHSKLSTYKIIVRDGSHISSITSCSISGSGQSWAPAVYKGKVALAGKVSFGLASCCSFCSSSSQVASTVEVLIQLLPFCLLPFSGTRSWNAVKAYVPGDRE